MVLSWLEKSDGVIKTNDWFMTPNYEISANLDQSRICILDESFII